MQNKTFKKKHLNEYHKIISEYNNFWNGTNPNNQLIDLVNQNNVDVDDKELKDYINNF